MERRRQRPRQQRPRRCRAAGGADRQGCVAAARRRTPRADARELRARLSPRSGRGDRRGVLPPRAQRLVELLAHRAFDTEVTHASADFAKAMVDGRWDQAERALDSVPRLAPPRSRPDRADRPRHRARRPTTGPPARRKEGIQRVLAGEPQRREAASAAPVAARQRAGTAICRIGVRSRFAAAAGASSRRRDRSAERRPTRVDAAERAATRARRPNGIAAGRRDRAWRCSRRCRSTTAPTRSSAAELAALTAAARRRRPEADAAPADASISPARVERVLQHRHHLFDQLGKLCHELTASLTDLAENDSWVKGQCEAMRIKIEEGLTRARRSRGERHAAPRAQAPRRGPRRAREGARRAQGR